MQQAAGLRVLGSSCAGRACLGVELSTHTALWIKSQPKPSAVQCVSVGKLVLLSFPTSKAQAELCVPASLHCTARLVP